MHAYKALDVIAEATRNYYVAEGDFPDTFTEESIKPYTDQSISALRVDHLFIHADSLDIYSMCSLPEVKKVVLEDYVEVSSFSIFCETTIYGGTSTCKIQTLETRYAKSDK